MQASVIALIVTFLIGVWLTFLFAGDMLAIIINGFFIYVILLRLYAETKRRVFWHIILSGAISFAMIYLIRPGGVVWALTWFLALTLLLTMVLRKVASKVPYLQNFI